MMKKIRNEGMETAKKDVEGGEKVRRKREKKKHKEQEEMIRISDERHGKDLKRRPA